MRIQIKGANVDKILQKNPQTNNGLYLDSYKDGIAICVAKEDEVNLLFHDQGHSFEYNDVQIDYKGLSHPALLFKLPSMFFREILDKKKYSTKNLSFLNGTVESIDALSSIYEFNITSVLLPSSYVELVQKYFTDIVLTETRNSIYNITYTSNSVFKGVNLLAILGLFFSLKLDNAVHINEGEYTKYAEMMSNVDIPYFIKYVYLTFVPVEFKAAVVKILSTDEIKFTGYRTQQNRLQEVYKLITEHIKDTNPEVIKVLDFGCGRLEYGKVINTLKKENPTVDIKYLGYDEVSFVTKAKQLNLDFTDDMARIDMEHEYDFVLVSEVLEHNDLNEITNICNYFKLLTFKHLYITTPNADFNQYYKLSKTEDDNGLRHWDHTQEFSFKDFKNLIHSEFTQEGLDLNMVFYQLGDSINDCRPTSVALVSKKH